jgi:hypothetical protein
MKISDLIRKYYNEKAGRMITTKNGVIHYSIEYVKWLESEVLKLNLAYVRKRAFNKWFESLKYIGCFILGMFTAIVISMFS